MPSFFFGAFCCFRFEPLQSLLALDMLCAPPQLRIRTPSRRKAGSESLTLYARSFPIYSNGGRQTVPYGMRTHLPLSRMGDHWSPAGTKQKRAIRESPLQVCGVL